MFRTFLLECSVQFLAPYGLAYPMQLGTETRMLLRYLLPSTYVQRCFLLTILLQLYDIAIENTITY